MESIKWQTGYAYGCLTPRSRVPCAQGLAYTLHTHFICDVQHRCSCGMRLLVLYKCYAFTFYLLTYFVVVKVHHPEENGSETVDSEMAENGEAEAKTDDSKVPKDIFDFYEKMDRDEDDETELQTVSFEIRQDSLEKLQKRFVTNAKLSSSSSRM